ncbi:uncharacterized protein LOC128554165 [Mercenaria mercenaria]|uniref:uncharacterized protein LOC128554165 n=1 Tax=Mercenaria mercenaria TaxID=6596 RepID=UPI00234EB3F3|nr:uncharacterized protein LOC128554165 [Mercenaria mercenaria]
MKDIQTYQGLPQLFQEPPSITWSPEKLAREYKKYREIKKEPTEEEVEKTLEDYEKEQALKSASYIPIDWGDESVGWVPQDEFKRLEDYGRKKISVGNHVTQNGTEHGNQHGGYLTFLPIFKEMAKPKKKPGLTLGKRSG